jgi:carboxyl-terminal processing protease
MKGFERFTRAKRYPAIIPPTRFKFVLLKRIEVLLITLILFLAGCTGGVKLDQNMTSDLLFSINTKSAPSPTPTPKPLPTIATTLTSSERVSIFEAAWQTVNDKYFDPTFGGKDWQAIGDEYRWKLDTVQDDHNFWFHIMNPMLFELGVSHLVALPAELSSELNRETFASGSLGMDVRLLDGKPVVTQVSDGSPADKAGLRPGYVISSIDGWTPNDLAAFDLEIPPENERNQRGWAVNNVRNTLIGEVDSEVVIEYLDANDQLGSATLEYAPRTDASCGQIDPLLPEACAEIEVRRLAGGIGYLRFSGFLMPVLDSVLKAINDFHDAPALIIDLRGNPGGQFPVRKAIASHLVGEAELFVSYKLRDGLELAYLDPVPDAYAGEVVILIDELSASSSEEFTGSLQALGRATIIGTQTPGSCLVMNVEPLPKGAILVYPYKQSRTPNGRILEDNGVIPDIEIALDRDLLLQGVDSQLEAAIDYLTEQIEQ